MAIVINPAQIGMRLRRLLPFLNWIGEIKDTQILRADIIAGITVALVLVPQSMAYAQLAGLPAYYGLYAAFLPPMVGALFGSSRQLATGPVAVVSLLTAAALEPIAATGSAGYVAYAITLSLLVGLFQLSLGLLRLGVVVNFLSHPVIVGFTNAAAIIIATSQLDKIFGVRIDKSEHHYETVWNTVVAIGHQTHWPTLLFGISAFAIMIALRRINPRIPNVLVAVTITTVISYFIGFEHLQTVAIEKFESDSVREVFADQARLKLEIPELDRSVAAAEKKHQDTLAKYDVDNSRTLTAQHNLDTLLLKRDRRIKSAKADLDEIKKQRFRYVPGLEGADGHYYHVGQVPDDAVTDKRLWRVRSIDGDKIILNGGGNVVGNIPEGLPTFALPKLDSIALLQLLSAAITISLIGFMEAISIAKAMAAKTRNKLDAQICCH